MLIVGSDPVDVERSLLTGGFACPFCRGALRPLGYARWRSSRREGGSVRHRPRRATDETESRAGRRVLGLPDALCRLLQQHKTRQDQERLRAGRPRHDGGWLFATETGEPINPRTDWDEWKRLLKKAGIRDGRLHDARHTAATVLLLLGVSERTIMGVMDWSNTAMTHRYALMVDPIRDDIARRLDGLLWPDPENGMPVKPVGAGTT